MFALSKLIISKKCYICNNKISFLNIKKRNEIKCTNCNLDIVIDLCPDYKEKKEPSSVDTLDESSSEEELSYDHEEFVLHNYEKDLEIAINLSLQYKKNNDDEHCIICFDKKITTAFIPCGHLCCCYECAKKCKKKCPMCRKSNKSIQKIYTI